MALSQPRKHSPNTISPPPLPSNIKILFDSPLNLFPSCDECWAPPPDQSDPMRFRGATPHSARHVAVQNDCWNSIMKILPISSGKSVLGGNWTDGVLGHCRCAEVGDACLVETRQLFVGLGDAKLAVPVDLPGPWRTSIVSLMQNVPTRRRVQKDDSWQSPFSVLVHPSSPKQSSPPSTLLPIWPHPDAEIWTSVTSISRSPVVISLLWPTQPSRPGSSGGWMTRSWSTLYQRALSPMWAITSSPPLMGLTFRKLATPTLRMAVNIAVSCSVPELHLTNPANIPLFFPAVVKLLMRYEGLRDGWA
jgi:hypothetical protein